MNNPLSQFGPSRRARYGCQRCACSPCRCMRQAEQPGLCGRCNKYPCGCTPVFERIPCDPNDYFQCPRGYMVGDLLTVVGGTFVTACTLTVTAINAQTGSVTAVSVTNAGNYSVFPSNPVSTTGGQGTGATFTLTTSGTGVTAAAVVAGGGPWPAGYRPGDVLQLQGGAWTTQASVTVTSVNSGGQVTGISIATAGLYSSQPQNPVPTLGGYGCGCKIQATWVAGALTAAAIANNGGPCCPGPSGPPDPYAGCYAPSMDSLCTKVHVKVYSNMAYLSSGAPGGAPSYDGYADYRKTRVEGTTETDRVFIVPGSALTGAPITQGGKVTYLTVVDDLSSSPLLIYSVVGWDFVTVPGATSPSQNVSWISLKVIEAVLPRIVSPTGPAGWC